MKQKFLFHLTASGFYTATCLASVSLSTDIIILKSAPDWKYFFFLFFATFLYYNFHKISWFGHHRMFESTNTKYLWPASYPGLLMLSLILGLMGSVALVTFCIHNAFQIAIGIIAGALALFYNQNIAGINLRSKKGYKPFTIAMVSIITAVLIPVFKKPIVEIDFQLLAFYAIAQWFFITAMCIAADMRDLEEDRQDHIKTFPVSAGLNISKKIIYLLLSIQIALMVLLYACSYINIQQFEVFILSSLLSILLVFQLNTLQSYYFFVLAIDGLILSQAFGLLILS